MRLVIDKDGSLRCADCDKKLGHLNRRTIAIVCGRCDTYNTLDIENISIAVDKTDIKGIEL